MTDATYKAIRAAARELRIGRRLLNSGVKCEQTRYADIRPQVVADRFGVGRWTLEVIRMAVGGIDRLRPKWEGSGGGPLPDLMVTAVLHTGFLSVPETPEMLARLPEREGADGAEAAPSRSRITDTPELIHPIDRVAARVSPPELCQREAT